MGQKKCKPQPGDLIEIDRPFHQHWALFMGDGYVINLTPAGKQKIKLGSQEVPVFTRMLKKQLLKEVVGNHKWRVNNKSDQCQTPLPVEEIIQCAEAYMGKEMAYCSFGTNCEKFVKKFRYGKALSEQLKAFVGGELQKPDMRDDKDNPQPGDMIEIKRGHYDHWALCMGNGYVIHVTTVDEGVPSLSTNNEKILIVKVTKEVLKEVVGNYAWAVNNKYDSYCSPLPVEDIIQRAEGFVGRELVYDVFEFESEDFVTKVRYGGQLKAFVDGELHILDMRDDKDSPKPGDMIEIRRPGYQHWAIYVGNGYVIHVTIVGKNSPPTSASSGSVLTRNAKLKKELLKEVVGNDAWAVNNKYDPYRSPFPAEEIIRRAERQIGEVVPYRLLYKNCEHFVTELRYGEALSEQALTARDKIRSIASPVVSGVGVAGVATLACLSLPTALPIMAAGFTVLANVGIASDSIADYFNRVKFLKANKDVLEEECC